MRAYGQYLDWVEWFAAIKRGDEDCPEELTYHDFAMEAKSREAMWQEKMNQFIHQTTETGSEEDD